ncbi:H-type lectin domain-containing protein [Actibacterium sp. MT2.3-13A]|uniref:H-type lectin domain-containing protein n=1 Tax=Actibacterium sp. MT2.3-13A TaxID=2828332 RepID=UPI001BAAA6BE|nr:H-type lectin domain-containing protein [Actibacterium sp. MT2.3-13A]
MLHLNASEIGIDQGSAMLFQDFKHDGVMWTGEGPRAIRYEVRFSRPFRAVPAVTVGMSLWDIDHGTNARADIRAEAITREGFHIVFNTWGDTRVARIRADWMAIGALPNPDDWEVS